MVISEAPLRARYYAQRAGWLVQGLALRAALGLAERPPELPASTLHEVRRRYRALLDRDLDDAVRGVYPKSLLFDMPSRRALPAFLAEVPRSRARRAEKKWNDLPEDVDLRDYPPYYRRNFHWQSDGWLSDRSAHLYDFSVEVLFLGAADAMRRRAIAPILAFAAEQGDRPLRVLDIACGTGRFLGQLGRAAPKHRYTGLDLSAWYLREAAKAPVRHLSVVEADAEATPFQDRSFDVVTSIFLFHELPPRARAAVFAEMARVLAPGGLAVVVDAIQLVDDPALEPILNAFPESFHEPFFRDHVEDDLGVRARAAGLQVERVEPWHVSKVVVARKPMLAAG
jgi:ubiquinone/menaquinone biosynthesis C-methylase UbiE